MTRNQHNRQAMHKSVIGLLESSVSITEPVASIARIYTSLVETADAIDDAAVTQQSSTGVAAAKKTAKTQLLDVAHDVAAAVVSFATENEDDELAGHCNLSRTALGQGRDGAVVSRCRKVHVAASEVVADLGGHGVTAPKLTTLKKKTDTFDKISTRPRQSVANSSAATKRLPVFFRQASRLLSKRLDTVMVQFKTTQPEFYARYKAARRVVDVAGRASKEEEAKSSSTTSTKAA